MKTILVLLVTLIACGDNASPLELPDAPEPHKPTCMNREPELDARCIAMFESGRVRFGFICDWDAPKPVGPEYPPSCWTFEAGLNPDGTVNNHGKMCCTTEGPVDDNAN